MQISPISSILIWILCPKMVSKWTGMFAVVLLGLACAEVLTSSQKAGGGRHTTREVSSSWKSTEGKRLDTKKTVPSEEEACRGIKCGPGKKCQLTAGGEATCACKQSCPKGHTRLLCASDGVTYTNECEMKSAACRQGSRLTVTHNGACQGLPTETPSPPISRRTHPIACYQVQRDTLQREVVKWLQGVQAADEPGRARPYETVLRDFFTGFDDSEDGFLDPSEFLTFVEHNATLRKATDDLNQDQEEDTLLRGLCMDALLAEADENFDWRLTWSEFMKAMMPGFSHPTQMCSLDGKYFNDGETKKQKCSLCICACGSWVCTANTCDGGVVAVETVDVKTAEEETMSRNTWVGITNELSPLPPDETVVDSSSEDAKARDAPRVAGTTNHLSPHSSGNVAKDSAPSSEGALIGAEDNTVPNPTRQYRKNILRRRRRS